VGPSHGPFAYLLPSGRSVICTSAGTKRELPDESAKKETAIAVSQQDDLERGLLFNLRSAFVQTLQAKAVLAGLEGQSGLLRPRAEDQAATAFRREICADRSGPAGAAAGAVPSRTCRRRGDLRTAKIQMLMLLNDRTPIEQFDLVGTFDFNDQIDRAGWVSADCAWITVRI